MHLGACFLGIDREIAPLACRYRSGGDCATSRLVTLSRTSVWHETLTAVNTGRDETVPADGAQVPAVFDGVVTMAIAVAVEFTVAKSEETVIPMLARLFSVSVNRERHGTPLESPTQTANSNLPAACGVRYFSGSLVQSQAASVAILSGNNYPTEHDSRDPKGALNEAETLQNLALRKFVQASKLFFLVNSFSVLTTRPRLVILLRLCAMDGLLSRRNSSPKDRSLS